MTGPKCTPFNSITLNSCRARSMQLYKILMTQKRCLLLCGNWRIPLLTLTTCCRKARKLTWGTKIWRKVLWEDRKNKNEIRSLKLSLTKATNLAKNRMSLLS